MDDNKLLDDIRRGRTDRVFDLVGCSNWRELIATGPISVLQWFVYYGDVTALKAILYHGGDLSTIDIHAELANAAFFGHWKVCEFLIDQGADVNHRVPETAETPLHNALAKAGRPHYLYTVRLLLECGADVSAKTNQGVETEAFMRDVRTKGETPLHRAAAYADEPIIEILLTYGADREARDAYGDSPLTWASEHLRPGKILSLLTFEPHRIGPAHVLRMVSDHGAGWGNGMEWNLMGEYRRLSDRHR